MLVAKFDGVGDWQCSRILMYEPLAPVVFKRDTNAPAILSTEAPRLSIRWFVVGYYVDSKWSQRRHIVVEGATEKLPGRNGWVCCGFAQKIEGCFCLRQQEVLEVAWKIRGHSSNYF